MLNRRREDTARKSYCIIWFFKVFNYFFRLMGYYMKNIMLALNKKTIIIKTKKDRKFFFQLIVVFQRFVYMDNLQLKNVSILCLSKFFSSFLVKSLDLEFHNAEIFNETLLDILVMKLNTEEIVILHKKILSILNTCNNSLIVYLLMKVILILIEDSPRTWILFLRII